MILIYYKTWVYQCLIKQVKSPSTWSRVPNSVRIRHLGRAGNRGVTSIVFFIAYFKSQRKGYLKYVCTTFDFFEYEHLFHNFLDISIVISMIAYLVESGSSQGA